MAEKIIIVGMKIESFLKGIGIKLPDEDTLVDYAYEIADEAIREYEKEEEIKLDDDTKQEIYDLFYFKLFKHLTPERIIDRCTNIDEIIYEVNWLCRKGQQSNIYEREIKSGDGIINWYINDGKIFFQIAEPFLIAYAEAVYGLYDIADEGFELEDMNQNEIIFVIRGIAELFNKKIIFDINDCLQSINWPGWYEIEQIVKKQRLYKKSRRR